MPKQKDQRIEELMSKGLSRATAYRRLGGIGHCKSCSCFKSAFKTVEPEYVEERPTELDTRIDRVKLQELRGNTYCPKHDVKKSKCLCP